LTLPAPVARDRIASLDIIRGVAVMGIFSVNVVAFAMIFPAYMNPGAYGGHSGENLATWLVNYILIDGKMRSLFSMLFGASMLLVIDRAEASGQSPARVHYARMVVLLLFGLLHFYVIWHGDILALYALTGMVAFAFRKRTTKTLLRWAVVLLVLGASMFGALSYAMHRADLDAHRPGATSKDIKRWNEMAGFAIRPAAANAEETRYARGNVVDRTRHMVTERGGEPFANSLAFMPSTLALMLFGMAGYRSGLLTGAWDDRRYRRIAGWTLGLGALATLALATWIIASNFYIPLLFFGLVSIGQPIQVAMAFGYASLIILLSRSGGAVAQRFGAVGRAAFSNYLGTSILGALIFFGDGLGWFGTVSRFEAWLVVPLFWLIMLAWSKPWLDRFHYGPLEWLWRSLARLEVQPMRRVAAARG
jgi:uncharacterized protein